VAEKEIMASHMPGRLFSGYSQLGDFVEIRKGGGARSLVGPVGRRIRLFGPSEMKYHARFVSRAFSFKYFFEQN
jgi:hypothetical protein